MEHFHVSSSAIFISAANCECQAGFEKPAKSCFGVPFFTVYSERTTAVETGANILKAPMPTTVIVVEYDPSWPALFRFFRERLARALGSMAAAIEHVGSTAVSHLAAKPIIDIDVLLADEADLPAAIDRLADIGYVYQGDLGIPGREAFLAPAQDSPHHLYVCPPQSREFQKHLAFRDYLRAHPEEAKEYGDLKQALALEFKDNRSAYIDGKTEFVARMTDRAMATKARV